MKQPEDNKTLDFLEKQKRGRGRPPVENALTPADRAKRYRDKKRQTKDNNSVTRHENTGNQVFMLECKIRQLESDVNAHREFARQWFEDRKAAQREIDMLKGELAESNTRTANLTSNGESVGMLESRIMALNAENGILGRELEDAKARIDDLCGALEVVVKLRSAKKSIPSDVLSALSKLLIARPKRKQSSL